MKKWLLVFVLLFSLAGCKSKSEYDVNIADFTKVGPQTSGTVIISPNDGNYIGKANFDSNFWDDKEQIPCPDRIPGCCVLHWRLKEKVKYETGKLDVNFVTIDSNGETITQEINANEPVCDSLSFDCSCGNRIQVAGIVGEELYDKYDKIEVVCVNCLKTIVLEKGKSPVVKVSEPTNNAGNTDTYGGTDTTSPDIEIKNELDKPEIIGQKVPVENMPSN
jgi:hypothetical protein